MSRFVDAVRFTQWLTDWDSYEYDSSQHRRRPDPHIYLFALPAIQLRALSGVYRRRREDGPGEGLQRRHDPARSQTIRDFVRYGYPFSSLPGPRRENLGNLKKPGWLPTAIVVNILGADDERRGRRVAESDLISIVDGNRTTATMHLPYEDNIQRWSPTSLEPIEVIDGQHRLWAFEEAIHEGALPGNFELPVVAFRGLDVAWQAYLFWSINISPKRINPSHAFDLFPLLRSEAWLETFSELRIYREARAQELVELLFQHPDSPWRGRINMLGESARDAPQRAGVTQAGWVRGLTASYLSAGGRGRGTNGLFAASISTARGPLDWSRAQQAALLILLWDALRSAVRDGSWSWASALREPLPELIIEEEFDPAFEGRHTMLNQEQGVRGVLSVSNDLLFRLAVADEALVEWNTGDEVSSATTIEDVSFALQTASNLSLRTMVNELAQAVASFDWRSADAAGLDETGRLVKRAFRGSGGYAELRQQLFAHIGRGESSFAAFARELVRGNA